MTPTLLRPALVCALLTLATGVAADPLLPVSNQGALARSFALPELGAAEVLAPNANEFRFSVDWTSEFVEDASPTESITLDGETQRFDWTWRHGLPHGFEVGLQLPFELVNGGKLDGIIHNYHELFGFPDGGRGEAPHGRLLYNYTRNGVTLVNDTHPATEFGDVQLNAGWQVLPSLALRTMLKLPTGHASHLTGGNTGGAVWLDFDPFAGSRHWLGFVSAGGSVNSRAGVLAEQQHLGVGFVGAGVGYRLWQPFALSAQVYMHSKLYKDSSLTTLRREGVQGAFGGRYDVNEHLTFNAGFQEDLVTESSPDFSIHISVVAR